MDHGRRRGGYIGGYEGGYIGGYIGGYSGGYEGPLARASKYSPTLTRAKRQATGSTV